jgi:DNA-directed RNA polymerase subunit M/transcription elongation factor TFIIS
MWRGPLARLQAPPKAESFPPRRSRYTIPTTMDAVNPAGELLRIAERYRQMSDEEIQILIPQNDNLTPFAQEALANEIRRRALKTEVAEVKSEQPSAPPRVKPPSRFEPESPKFRDHAGDDSPDPNSDDSESPYEEDRKLIDLCTVWSVRDALQVQTLLDGPGIPFFMGSEKATGVETVSSNFAKGVVVQIMQIGWPWAAAAMQHYEPKDDPTPKEPEEPGELTVRCPQCHSAEVVFEGGILTPIVTKDDSTQKYQWTCESCGHQWEDDGVAKEE